jgi:hypothetical protein
MDQGFVYDTAVIIKDKGRVKGVRVCYKAQESDKEELNSASNQHIVMHIT